MTTLRPAFLAAILSLALLGSMSTAPLAWAQSQTSNGSQPVTNEADDATELDRVIVVGDAFTEAYVLRACRSSTSSQFPVDTDTLPNTTS